MIKRSCYWYTWGGDSDKGFNSYPREYGARCTYPKVDSFFADYNKFVNGREVHDYRPDCSICKYYDKSKKRKCPKCGTILSKENREVRQIPFDYFAVKCLSCGKETEFLGKLVFV